MSESAFPLHCGLGVIEPIDTLDPAPDCADLLDVPDPIFDADGPLFTAGGGTASLTPYVITAKIDQEGGVPSSQDVVPLTDIEIITPPGVAFNDTPTTGLNYFNTPFNHEDPVLSIYDQEEEELYIFRASAGKLYPFRIGSIWYDGPNGYKICKCYPFSWNPGSGGYVLPELISANQVDVGAPDYHIDEWPPGLPDDLIWAQVSSNSEIAWELVWAPVTKKVTLSETLYATAPGAITYSFEEGWVSVDVYNGFLPEDAVVLNDTEVIINHNYEDKQWYAVSAIDGGNTITLITDLRLTDQGILQQKTRKIYLPDYLTGAANDWATVKNWSVTDCTTGDGD